MTVLVTGGLGFIGSAFVRALLRDGESVTVLDRETYAADRARLEGQIEGLEIVKGDVAEPRDVLTALKASGARYVVHFAAETHVDRSIADAADFVRTNCQGTQVLLDACRHMGVERIVNISTDEVYGSLESTEGSFTETTPLDPRSPYSASKAAADMMGRAYWRTHGLPVVTVRPSNVYGPWQFPEKLIPVVVMRALAGQPIPVYGDGRHRREWLFVEDCAEGVRRALEKGEPGETYNLGSGNERANLDLVKAIVDILGQQQSLIDFVADRPGHDLRYRLDTQSTEDRLGWRAGTALQEGLERTVLWYRDNLDWAKERLVLHDAIR